MFKSMFASNPWQPRALLVKCLNVGFCVILGACTVAPQAPEPGQAYTTPIYTLERTAMDDVDAPLQVLDPWQSYNRNAYWFNAKLDDYLLNPAIAGYRTITPTFFRSGVTNFFDNLDEVRTLLNQVLQMKWRPAWDTSRRFATNSTLGIAGVLDVASRFGINKHDEDFGQTLGHYGIGEGPYLVLPLFGPSSLRDALGRGVDLLALSRFDPLELERHTDRGYVYYPLLILDTRATTAFQYYETGSPFEYELLRRLYTTKRQLDIAK